MAPKRTEKVAKQDREVSDGNGQAVSKPEGRLPASRSTTGDLLALMEALAGVDRIGVTQLSRQMGVPVATAYRMLRVLQRSGFVEQLSQSKEYRLTLKLFELGCQVASRTTMRDVAAVEIERLAQQTGTATNVGVLLDNYVLYLVKVETDDLITLNLRPGSRAPATCTAMGKAMLAVETRPLRSIVGDGPYIAKTEHSITSHEALSAELEAVRRQGYAVDRQELSLGLWCVAAPILGTRVAQSGAVSVASYGAALECRRVRPPWQARGRVCLEDRETNRGA